MTSGLYSEGIGFPLPTPFREKAWSGTNGKYEVVNGYRRIRWNNYQMYLIDESAQLGGSFPEVTAGAASVPPWSDLDEFQLQSRLVQRIKGHQFNLAVNLAQSNKLVAMCVDNIRRFSRSLRALKHGDFATAARQLGVTPRRSNLSGKDVSGRWLELQYGWIPAISDTFEAAKAYEGITKARSTRIVATLKRTQDIDGSASIPNYSAPGVYWKRKSIKCELTEQLNAPRSLGLMDPLSVVWEIIPYSFVFDWFLPIGSYFENLAVLPYLEGRFMSTLTTEYKARVGPIFNPAYAGKRRVFYRKTVKREVTTSLTTQLPSFNSPSVALSARRIYNAVALAHQRL